MANASESEGVADIVACTVCDQDLSSGLFKLDDHPTLRGIAVCPRCHDSLEDSLNERNGEPDDDTCAWCEESEGVNLFLCDKQDCGRAFCATCMDKLGEGTSAAMRACNDEWICLRCDDTPLIPLQKLLRAAVEDPPPLARVLARLSKDEPEHSDTEDAPLTASITSDSTVPLRLGDATLDPGGLSMRPEAAGNEGVGGSCGGCGGEGEVAAAGKAVSDAGEERKVVDPKQVEEEDQELLDAAVDVERRIQESLENLDNTASDRRRQEISDELRGLNPDIADEELEAMLSCEMQNVMDMWAYTHEALLDIQPVLAEALNMRGISESAIERVKKWRMTDDGGGGGSTAANAGHGAGEGLAAVEDDGFLLDDDDDDEDDNGGRSGASGVDGKNGDGSDKGDDGGILAHLGSGGTNSAEVVEYDSADAIINVCNSVWAWLVSRRAGSAASMPPPGGGGGGLSSSSGGGDGVEGPLVLDAAFFRRAVGAVNDIVRPGFGPRWSEKRMAVAADRAVAFFLANSDEEIAMGVNRPSTEEVKAWKLGGKRAESVSAVIRWIVDRKAKDERMAAESLDPFRFDDHEDSERSPPSDLDMLLEECRIMRAQIKKLDPDSPEQDLSTFTSVQEGQEMWSRLQRERVIKVAESQNAAQLVEAGALGAGLGKAVCQVDDLGTTAEEMVRASRGRLISKDAATRMLNAAMANESSLAVSKVSEKKDKKECVRERRKAVATQAKRAPRKPRRPRDPAAPRKRAPRAPHKRGSAAGPPRPRPSSVKASPVTAAAVAAATRNGNNTNDSGDHSDVDDIIDDSELPPAITPPPTTTPLAATAAAAAAAVAAVPEERPPIASTTATVGGLRRGEDMSHDHRVDGVAGAKELASSAAAAAGADAAREHDGDGDVSMPDLVAEVAAGGSGGICCGSAGGDRGDDGASGCADGNWMTQIEEKTPPRAREIVGDKSSGSDGRGLGSSRVTRVEQFVARLKDMGVDRSVFERQFSRRRLVGLLNRSKHDMDTAVLRFFEDEHKLKEIEKFRKRSLRSRDGPESKKCYFCGSKNAGAWKRMRRRFEGPDKSHFAARESPSVSGSTAVGGGSGAIRGSLGKHEVVPNPGETGRGIPASDRETGHNEVKGGGDGGNSGGGGACNDGVLCSEQRLPSPLEGMQASAEGGCAGRGSADHSVGRTGGVESHAAGSGPSTGVTARGDTQLGESRNPQPSVSDTQSSSEKGMGASSAAVELPPTSAVARKTSGKGKRTVKDEATAVRLNKGTVDAARGRSRKANASPGTRVSAAARRRKTGDWEQIASKVEGGGSSPDEYWVCPNENCLQSALAAGYGVEEVSVVKPMGWIYGLGDRLPSSESSDDESAGGGDSQCESEGTGAEVEAKVERSADAGQAADTKHDGGGSDGPDAQGRSTELRTEQCPAGAPAGMVSGDAAADTSDGGYDSMHEQLHDFDDPQDLGGQAAGDGDASGGNTRANSCGKSSGGIPESADSEQLSSGTPAVTGAPEDGDTSGRATAEGSGKPATHPVPEAANDEANSVLSTAMQVEPQAEASTTGSGRGVTAGETANAATAVSALVGDTKSVDDSVSAAVPAAGDARHRVDGRADRDGGGQRCEVIDLVMSDDDDDDDDDMEVTEVMRPLGGRRREGGERTTSNQREGEGVRGRAGGATREGGDGRHGANIAPSEEEKKARSSLSSEIPDRAEEGAADAGGKGEAGAHSMASGTAEEAGVRLQKRKTPAGGEEQEQEGEQSEPSKSNKGKAPFRRLAKMSSLVDGDRDDEGEAESSSGFNTDSPRAATVNGGAGAKKGGGADAEDEDEGFCGNVGSLAALTKDDQLEEGDGGSDDGDDDEEDTETDDDCVEILPLVKRRERPEDKKEEDEVDRVVAKEKARLERVHARKISSPQRPRASPLKGPRNLHPYSPTSASAVVMVEDDVAEPDNPQHVHVLEELGSDAGEHEGKFVAISPAIGRFLYPHQVEGVQFMYDNLVVNTGQLRAGGEDAEGNGCILAHCMGLGKTVQAIAILDVLLSNPLVQEAATSSVKPPNESPENSVGSSSLASGSSSPLAENGACVPPPDSEQQQRPQQQQQQQQKRSFLRTVLIVVPKNVLGNWADELRKWLPGQCNKGKVFVMDTVIHMTERPRVLEKWQDQGGVMVMSYNMFRASLSRSCESGATCRKCLQDPGPDVIIADEAHLLKNEQAKVTVAMKGLRTRRRVALTGSPLQNNLMEYYTMVDFVRSGMLGTSGRFKNKFEIPITNGMLKGCPTADVKKSHGRAYVLHETLKGFVQRKDITTLAAFLPPSVVKEEIVVTVRPSEKQRALTKRLWREAKEAASGKSILLMSILMVLQLVWTHPAAYEAAAEAKAALQLANAEEAAVEASAGSAAKTAREADVPAGAAAEEVPKGSSGSRGDGDDDGTVDLSSTVESDGGNAGSTVGCKRKRTTVSDTETEMATASAGISTPEVPVMFSASVAGQASSSEGGRAISAAAPAAAAAAHVDTSSTEVDRSRTVTLADDMDDETANCSKSVRGVQPAPPQNTWGTGEWAPTDWAVANSLPIPTIPTVVTPVVSAPAANPTAATPAPAPSNPAAEPTPAVSLAPGEVAEASIPVQTTAMATPTLDATKNSLPGPRDGDGTAIIGEGDAMDVDGVRAAGPNATRAAVAVVASDKNNGAPTYDLTGSPPHSPRRASSGERSNKRPRLTAPQQHSTFLPLPPSAAPVQAQPPPRASGVFPVVAATESTKGGTGGGSGAVLAPSGPAGAGGPTVSLAAAMDQEMVSHQENSGTEPTSAKAPGAGGEGNAAVGRTKNKGRRKKRTKVALKALGNDVDIRDSGKMVALMEIIAQATAMGDKVLVFSQRLSSLDFIERTLMTKGWGGSIKTPPPKPQQFIPWRPNSKGAERSTTAGGGDEACWGPWRNGREFFRLEGCSSTRNRQRMIEQFNNSNESRVFMLSTRAGNMGINLVAANRVVLLDTSWNPANDLQAMFRCYRFGQTKPVEVYRLIMGRSLEYKIHNKQVTKHALAGRVVDARNPVRKISRDQMTLVLDEDEYIDEDEAAVELPVDDNLQELLGIEAAGEDGEETETSASCRRVDTVSEGSTAAVPAPSSGVQPAASLHIPEGVSGVGPSGATTAATGVGTSAVGGGAAGEDGGEAMEDTIMAHLIREFHPEYLSSWVANKRLLEDDPMEKLNDDEKKHATQQYNLEGAEELRKMELLRTLQRQRPRPLPPAAAAAAVTAIGARPAAVIDSILQRIIDANRERFGSNAQVPESAMATQFSPAPHVATRPGGFFTVPGRGWSAEELLSHVRTPVVATGTAGVVGARNADVRGWSTEELRSSAPTPTAIGGTAGVMGANNANVRGWSGEELRRSAPTPTPVAGTAGVIGANNSDVRGVTSKENLASFTSQTGLPQAVSSASPRYSPLMTRRDEEWQLQQKLGSLPRPLPGAAAPPQQDLLATSYRGSSRPATDAAVGEAAPARVGAAANGGIGGVRGSDTSNKGAGIVAGVVAKAGTAPSVTSAGVSDPVEAKGDSSRSSKGSSLTDIASPRSTALAVPEQKSPHQRKELHVPAVVDGSASASSPTEGKVVVAAGKVTAVSCDEVDTRDDAEESGRGTAAGDGVGAIRVVNGGVVANGTGEAGPGHDVGMGRETAMTAATGMESARTVAMDKWSGGDTHTPL